MWLLSSCHVWPAWQGAGLSCAELSLNGHTWLPYWTTQLLATAIPALSVLAPPTSVSRPASNTVGILRHAWYKLLHLSLIPWGKCGMFSQRIQMTKSSRDWKGMSWGPMSKGASPVRAQHKRHLSAHGDTEMTWAWPQLCHSRAQKQTTLKEHSRRGYFSCLSCGLHVTTRTKLSLLGPVTKLLVKKNQRAVKGSFNSGS